MLDISGLGALRRIEATPRYLRIGAGVTWSDLLRAELPPCFDGLKLAAREVGGVQIQNTGTIAGNVCNASPAADSMPNLLALDAEVELASAAGERRLPIWRVRHRQSPDAAPARRAGDRLADPAKPRRRLAQRAS